MKHKWVKKYEAYEKQGSDGFVGAKTETVIVEKATDKVVGHFVQWDNSSVVDEHNPAEDGLVGTDWKRRPKGWRKCRRQPDVLDWAIEALDDW